MSRDRRDLLQGTLDLLILRALVHGAEHGYGVSIRIREMSDEVLRIEQGSLYPALYRLETQGCIRSTWGVSDNKRRARFYELTERGREHLVVEQSQWDRLSAAVNRVLLTEIY